MPSGNFDLQEKAKFDALASDWWNIHGKCKPLHEINPVRLQFILDNCKSLKDRAVLDVGCGGGILAESLARHKAKVTGIDIADCALAIAKQHAQQEGLEIAYHHGTAEEWVTEHSATYDILTCMELLEHVPHPEQLVQACAALVKPSGQLFFSTLNRNLKAFLYAIVGAEYVLNLLPRGTHEYAKFIRPFELEEMLSTAGLRLTNICGIHYHPFNKEYYLSGDPSVNYIVECVKEGDAGLLLQA